MKSLRNLALVAAALLLLAGNAWPQVTVAGVKYEETGDVRGAKVQLNGAGVRYKAVFKVYALGLYLTRKAGSPEEVIAAPGPKRISLVMLREIESAELGKLFTRSVEDNMTRSEFSKIIPGLVRMGQVFADQRKLVAGDTLMIDWIPGTGTVVTIKGVVQGEPFKEPEFFNAMLSIWLGKSPADWKLKDAMLGRPA